jgi:hypothetical protein
MNAMAVGGEVDRKGLAVALTDANPSLSQSFNEIFGNPLDPSSESPEVLSESPEVLSESPEVLSESPEVLSESPEVLSESPEVLSESPEVLEESPQWFF